MPTPGEPDYRYYNCNLQAPKIKCKVLTADQVTGSSVYLPSGLGTLNGYFPLSSSFTFTTANFPPLLKNDFNGELVLYLSRSGSYGNVTQSCVVKIGGVVLAPTIYQRIGNMKSVLSSVSGNTFTYTVNPSVECRWIYRGIV